jgi:hypothetical protein
MGFTLRIVLPVCVIGVVAAAACGQEQPPLEDRTMHEALEADRELAACLAEAGYGSSLEDADLRRLEEPQFNTAVEDCAEQLGIDVPEPGDTTRALADTLRSLVECLRTRGWEVPEPVVGPHGSLSIDDIGALVSEDQYEEFSADVEACGEVKPTTGRRTE